MKPIELNLKPNMKLDKQVDYEEDMKEENGIEKLIRLSEERCKKEGHTDLGFAMTRVWKEIQDAQPSIWQKLKRFLTIKKI